MCQLTLSILNVHRLDGNYENGRAKCTCKIGTVFINNRRMSEESDNISRVPQCLSARDNAVNYCTRAQ